MKLFLNILIIISILIIVCVILVCCISYYENRKLVVTKYSIHDPLIPKNFNGLHLLQITDLHNASFGENNEILIKQISNLHPDFILVTGDMIVGKPGKDVIFAAKTLNNMVKIAPVYFSMGNHELRVSLYTDTYQDMWECFINHLSPEIHLLFNKHVVLKRGEDKIHLYGLNLTPVLYKRFVQNSMPENYLQSLFGICNPKEYHILMAHNPDYFENYVEWGANLVFSGHIHGGMIRIPFLGGALSPMVRFFPKYDKGIFKLLNKYMILSGGLGNHTFKFRVNNLPEIISVTLNK